MKVNLRKERGVTMITLTITIIILMVITGILIYNARDIVYIKNYNALKNDIQLLRSKVSEYYNEYGTIPAKAKCSKISVGLETVFTEDELNNEGELYVLDLEALDGLTLNYGKDYEEVKDLAEVDDYYSDLYLIHGMTHNIFLNGGIKFAEGDTINFYYTDYDTPDQARVDFRYVDGIKIPDGYYYIGRDEAKDIVISQNLNDAINLEQDNQYYWKETEEILEDVVLQEGQTMEEYEQSTWEHKGYYVNDKTKKVIYLDVKMFIPSTSDTTPYLLDRNSTILSGTNLENGLVMIDGNKNEWVWIEVPKSIFSNVAYTGGQSITSSEGDENLEKIEQTLKNYASDYGYENWNDVYYEGCGLESEGQYISLKNRMLKSVFDNGGFWIGRYEAGSNEYLQNENEVKDRDLVIQKDKYTYNFVITEKAQELSETLVTNNERVSSLMFGIQWDLICKYIETKNIKLEDGTLVNEYFLTHNSKEIGNYSSSKFTITSMNAQKLNSNESNYSAIAQNQVKNANEGILLTTGASDTNKILNIYDLAGNQFEMTLEHSKTDEYPTTVRGGESGGAGYLSSHDYVEYNIGYKNISFRPTIF
mgnify:CR=1 FL=1